MVEVLGATKEREVKMTKNPGLSLWLSAANTWAGAARGFRMAEMHRQQKTQWNEMTPPAGRSVTKSPSKKASTGARQRSKR